MHPKVPAVEPYDDNSLRMVWKKIDAHVLPVAALFYTLSYLDRTNIGNARIAGLQKDLELTNYQYCIALTVTYVPYSFVELPSNLLLKTVGPDRMLPMLMTLWGIVAACQGAVTSYGELLACRFCLGLVEGGLSPGLVLYLSFFYPRQLLNTRIAAFFATASLAGAFSGVLAYGITFMDGLGHVHGWAWIFILEGLLTVLVGLSSFFFLPRSLQHCNFLEDIEKSQALKELQDTGSSGSNEGDRFHWIEVGRALASPHVLIVAMLFFFTGAAIGGLAYFTPSIVHELGYTAEKAQLFTVPPFSVAFVACLVLSYFSDRYHCRGLVEIVSGILCVIGFAMYLGFHSFRLKYASLFLSIPGAYSSIPALSAWSVNNTLPHTRRATATAIQFIFANFGAVLVIWLFGTISPPPLYRKACITLLVFSGLLIVFSCLNSYYLSWSNRKKAFRRGAFRKEDEDPGLGDRSAWFIYSL